MRRTSAQNGSERLRTMCKNMRCNIARNGSERFRTIYKRCFKDIVQNGSERFRANKQNLCIVQNGSERFRTKFAACSMYRSERFRTVPTYSSPENFRCSSERFRTVPNYSSPEHFIYSSERFRTVPNQYWDALVSFHDLFLLCPAFSNKHAKNNQKSLQTLKLWIVSPLIKILRWHG